MMKRLLLYILCLFVWMQAQAQKNYTLTGIVSDSNGMPISNANVQILENNKPIAYSFTNEKGSYALSYNSSKTQVLLSIGHISFEKTKLVIDSKETKKNITLLEKDAVKGSCCKGSTNNSARRYTFLSVEFFRREGRLHA